MVAFLTTEHFTLQGTRASAVGETSTRLQLYMGVLSSFILALALVAQVAEFGKPFFALTLVLMSIVYFLGLATIGRLWQIWRDWFFATQGMSRIRRYFLEAAPETQPYLTMPTSDDPFLTLAGAGISRKRRWWGGFVTAIGLVGIVNSVVAGAIGALIAALVTEGGIGIPAIAAGVAFSLSFVLITRFGQREFEQNAADAEVRFPPPPSS